MRKSPQPKARTSRSCNKTHRIAAILLALLGAYTITFPLPIAGQTVVAATNQPSSPDRQLESSWAEETRLAKVALRLGQDSLAMSHLLKAYNIAEKITDNGLCLSETTRDLGDIYVKSGKYAQAEDMYRKSVELKEKLYGPNNQWLDPLLNALILTYTKEGKFGQVIESVNKRIQVQEKLESPQSQHFQEYLSKIADTYGMLMTSNPPAAMRAAIFHQMELIYSRLSSLSLQQQPPDYGIAARFEYMTGSMLHEQLHCSESARHYKQCIALLARAGRPNKELESNAWIYLCQQQCELGLHNDVLASAVHAEKLLNDSLTDNNKRFGINSEASIECLRLLGLVSYYKLDLGAVEKRIAELKQLKGPKVDDAVHYLESLLQFVRGVNQSKGKSYK